MIGTEYSMYYTYTMVYSEGSVVYLIRTSWSKFITIITITFTMCRMFHVF